jgi:hypothetical protein
MVVKDADDKELDGLSIICHGTNFLYNWDMGSLVNPKSQFESEVIGITWVCS